MFEGVFADDRAGAGHVLPHHARLDQPHPLPGEEPREARVLDEHADLDVPLLPALRELRV